LAVFGKLSGKSRILKFSGSQIWSARLFTIYWVSYVLAKSFTHDINIQNRLVKKETAWLAVRVCTDATLFCESTYIHFVLPKQLTLAWEAVE